MNLRTTLIVFLCFCATTVLRAERVDMLKAGAKANGKTLNTKLINSTIDRLNRGGGGTLFFPAGIYLTGSIHLKSNITLEDGKSDVAMYLHNPCSFQHKLLSYRLLHPTLADIYSHHAYHCLSNQS